MPMKVAGLVDTELDAMRLARDEASERIALDNVEMFAVFNPEMVELLRVGDTYEPVLRIAGYVDRVVPTAPEMPYDLREVCFDGEARPYMTADYHFSRAQQAQLVEKGLYEDEFVPPRQTLQDVDLEFKIAADMTIYPPLEAGQAPIVVVDMDTVDRIDTDMSHSGYNLSEYFAAIDTPELGVEDRERVREAELDNDMFADLDFARDTSHDKMVLPQKQSAQERLLELSNGKLEFTAEEILDELGLQDEELVELARARADREAEQLSTWEREVQEKYNAAVRDAAQGERAGVRERDIDQSLADEFEDENLDEITFDESELDLDDDVTTSAESQSKVDDHQAHVADDADFDELDLDAVEMGDSDFDEIDFEELDLDNETSELAERTAEREGDAERARRVREQRNRRNMQERVRQAQADAAETQPDQSTAREAGE